MAANLSLFAPITKSEKLEDGSLLVYGKMTGPDLDLDGQRCDPGWLSTAVPEWAQVGNVREMHQPIAVGKATAVEQDGDDWFCTAKIVDPAAVKKVDEGILNGFSIGIKSPRLRKTSEAPNGLIYGGKIVETSLVDSPCNESCKLVLAKTVSVETPGITTEELQPVDAPELVEKRDFSTDERSHLAGTGAALPDGSFPIQNREDLENAVKAYGRAKDPDAAKKHIISRARALHAEDALPHDWISTQYKGLTADDGDQDSALDRARSAVRELIAMEAKEVGDGSGTTGPLHAVASLLDQLDWYEHLDIEDDEANAAEKVAKALRALKEPPVATTTLPDLVKAVTGGDVDADQLAELRKALIDLEGIKAEVTAAVEDALKDVTARLTKVEEMPAGNGPRRVAPQEAERAAERDRLTARAEALIDKAGRVQDPQFATALMKLAEKCAAEALAA